MRFTTIGRTKNRHFGASATGSTEASQIISGITTTTATRTASHVGRFAGNARYGGQIKDRCINDIRNGTTRGVVGRPTCGPNNIFGNMYFV